MRFPELSVPFAAGQKQINFLFEKTREYLPAALGPYARKYGVCWLKIQLPACLLIVFVQSVKNNSSLKTAAIDFTRYALFPWAQMAQWILGIRSTPRGDTSSLIASFSAAREAGINSELWNDFLKQAETSMLPDLEQVTAQVISQGIVLDTLPLSVFKLLFPKQQFNEFAEASEEHYLWNNFKGKGNLGSDVRTKVIENTLAATKQGSFFWALAKYEQAPQDMWQYLTVKGPQGETVLCHIARQGGEDLAERLDCFSFNPADHDRKNMPFLVAAIENGEPEDVQEIVKSILNHLNGDQQRLYAKNILPQVLTKLDQVIGDNALSRYSVLKLAKKSEILIKILHEISDPSSKIDLSRFHGLALALEELSHQPPYDLYSPLNESVHHFGFTLQEELQIQLRGGLQTGIEEKRTTAFERLNDRDQLKFVEQITNKDWTKLFSNKVNSFQYYCLERYHHVWMRLMSQGIISVSRYNLLSAFDILGSELRAKNVEEIDQQATALQKFDRQETVDVIHLERARKFESLCTPKFIQKARELSYSYICAAYRHLERYRVAYADKIQRAIENNYPDELDFPLELGKIAPSDLLYLLRCRPWKSEAQRLIEEFIKLDVEWNDEWEAVAVKLQEAPYNLTSIKLNTHPRRFEWLLRNRVEAARALNGLNDAKAWADAAELCFEYPTVAARLPLWKTSELLALPPFFVRDLVSLGVWTDVNSFHPHSPEQDGANLLHILASVEEANDQYSTAVQAIIAAQGNHADAFLVTPNAQGRLPVEIAIESGSPLVSLLWEHTKNRLQPEEVVRIFTKLVEVMPGHQLKALAPLFGMNPKPLFDIRKATIDGYRGLLQLKWPEPSVEKNMFAGLDGSAQEMANPYMRAAKIKMVLEMLGEYASLMSFDIDVPLQFQIKDLAESTFQSALEAKNWSLFAAHLSAMTEEERAEVLSTLQLPEELGHITACDFTYLMRLGMFSNPEKNHGKNVAHRYMEAYQYDDESRWGAVRHFLDQHQDLWTATSIAEGMPQRPSAIAMLFRDHPGRFFTGTWDGLNEEIQSKALRQFGIKTTNPELSSVPKSLKPLFKSDSQDYIDNYANLTAGQVKEAKKVIKETLFKDLPVDLFGLYYSEELIKWKRGESNLAHVLYGVFDEKHTTDILKSFSYRVEAPVLVFNNMSSPMISNIGAVYHLRALWGQMLLIFPDLTSEDGSNWVNGYCSGFSKGWLGLRDLFGHVTYRPEMKDNNLLLSIEELQNVHSPEKLNEVIQSVVSYVQEPELVRACIETLVQPIGV